MSARTALVMSFLAMLVIAVSAQPIAQAPRGTVELDAHLAALDGSDAMAYFELAEEIAYEEPGARALVMARQLFVLAFEVDRSSAQPRQLGPSVCMALADLAESHADRRWLLMLADAMRGRAIRSGGTLSGDEVLADQDAADRLVEAISHMRAGRFRELRDDLVRIGINLTRAQGERLRGGGALEAGGQWAARRFRLAGLEGPRADDLADAMVRAAGTVPCTTCGGARVVDRRDPEDGATVGVDLCPNCRGVPASLTINEQMNGLALRAQALLLEAQPATWSAQHLIDPQGAPMRDLDPDELAPAFGVDPAARVWQPMGLTPLDGHWKRPE